MDFEANCVPMKWPSGPLEVAVEGERIENNRYLFWGSGGGVDIRMHEGQRSETRTGSGA